MNIKIGDKLRSKTDVGDDFRNLFFKKSEIYIVLNIIKHDVFLDRLECGYMNYPIVDHEIERFFVNIREERKRKLNKINE